MLFLASSMLGVISYRQLQMEIMPNAELPLLYIQVNSRIDQTPEYMEQEVIIPIESAVAGLENIEEIISSCSRRRGSVLIYYEKRTDLKYAYLKLDERLTAIKGSLPPEISLSLQKVDLENKSNVLMQLQTLGSGGIDRVRNVVDQHIVPELMNVDGVAMVNVYGGKQKSVEIILDRAACDAYNINPSRVKNVLSRNMNMRQYGGLINDGGKRFFVYLNAEYDDISQIENLVVGRGRNPVQIKDIAKIHYGEKEEETLSRINGKDAVSMRVVYDAQANMIDLSHAVREQIERVNEKVAYLDVEILIQEDAAESMEKNIDQIINLALLGGFLAVFILWIFLRNIRLVLIVAIAMPVSIFTAFNFFYWAGISVNSLTLMGIALAVGMLLDTSVVVLENIYRLRSQGFPRAEAVVKGTGEVWRAIIAATLTTIAVFVPFLFSGDYLIRLFGQHIGVSIISTLIVSLFVSLLLIPMLVYTVMAARRKGKDEVYRELSLDNSGIRIYLSLLKSAIRNPGFTIISVVILFFLTIVVSMSVSVNKLNELETEQISLYITMPTGATLEATDAAVAQMEEVLSDLPEKEEMVATIEAEEATITILLREDYTEIQKRSFGEIQNAVLQQCQDIGRADVSLTPTSSSGGSGSRTGGAGGGSRGSDFQKLMGIGEDEEYLVLKGQDFDLMVEVAEDVETYLEELDNIRSVRLSVRENQPEVHLALNEMLMERFGLSPALVANELSTFQSEISSGVNFRQGDEEYDIIIKYADDLEEGTTDKTMEDLQTMEVADSEEENLYEMQEIADIFFARGMREIARTNQEKQVELRYRYNSDVYESNELLEYARSEIKAVIEDANIPAGVAVELVQEDSGLDEFKLLFVIALLLVYMILAAIFESFLTPFVLLLSIPLAAIGSFFMLTITGQSLFNANTLMGFLILLGVVVNNAIILIDFINVLQKRGYRKMRAIMLGGMSRLRPILITTITTCVAMLPLALGKAEYVKAIGPPFAITVIGGLSVSTLLTLVFIPMLYNGLDVALKWFRELKLHVQLVLLMLAIAGIVLVSVSVQLLIWKIAGYLSVVAGVPLGYWFISNSLRKSRETIISGDASLHIHISNLVKVYGRGTKIAREFSAARKMAQHAGRGESTLGFLLQSLIWQLPLFGFLVYFTWFHLVSGFWQLVSSIALYYFLIQLLGRFRAATNSRLLKTVLKLIRYAGPLVILGSYWKAWDNPSLSIITGLAWYLVLAVIHVRTSIQRDGFDVQQIRKVFRWFYKGIMRIPGLGKGRDEFKALKGVSIEIGSGMFGLLGPNGAGKSTLIRIVCGILEQSYGKVYINGIDTQLKREELQALIGYLPQEFGMYENMTSENYLDYMAILKGITNPGERKKRLRQVLESVHMWEHRKKKIGTYSGGMKQRIGIAQVLLHLPRILVVDEPTAGLDPRERIRFRNLLVELSRNRIVIFSTHIIEDISSSCNTMAVINKGEVLFYGTPLQMTEIARGKVWKSVLPADAFEEQTSNMTVIHHMRENENIRLRSLSERKPFADSVEEMPLLEDAYLWLLQNANQKETEQ
jgi:multidrug efflux pump subunit AcrB/ABC-type multidrug transport system ATPase subunit